LTFRAIAMHRSDPRWLIDEELDAAADLIAGSPPRAPLETLAPGDHALAALAKCHRDAIDAGKMRTARRRRSPATTEALADALEN
jgi:hypothetical protein